MTANTLEERIARLEKAFDDLLKKQDTLTPYRDFQTPRIVDSGCFMCGGKHGGLPCPTMIPMCGQNEQTTNNPNQPSGR